MDGVIRITITCDKEDVVSALELNGIKTDDENISIVLDAIDTEKVKKDINSYFNWCILDVVVHRLQTEGKLPKAMNTRGDTAANE